MGQQLPLDTETGPVPPALPPRGSARQPGTTVTGTAAEHSAGVDLPASGGLAVLPVAEDAEAPAAWSLYFDHPVPSDHSGRAMLDRAARLASRTLARAR